MKKKLLKIPMPLVLAITFIFLSSTNASAESISTEIPSLITYYDDGSYKIDHYNNNKNLCWTYTLKAYFTVNKGVSVKYKSCTGSLQILNNHYSPCSEHHRGSNNKATGTIKIKHGDVISSHTTTITCTKYGNFK